MRRAILRRESWKVPMNYIDVVVFEANPIPFQLLCIEKLAGAIRMVTMNSGMSSLHLLIRCLAAGTNIFFTLVFCWICFQCVSEMVANTFCQDFINEESQSLRGREIEASAEIEAAEEAEENFEALGMKVSRAWSTCKEQLSARLQVSDAEAAVREDVRKDVRKVKCRLEKMRELAKAAAAAAERKVEASRGQLKSISCRAEAAALRSCRQWSCEELAASAQRAVAQQVEAFAALCEQRTEEENQAEAAEEGAMAEEVWIFEDLSFQRLLEKERKLITIEAVSYGERSTRELLNYMEKVEPIESSSQITDLLDNQTTRSGILQDLWTQFAACHLRLREPQRACKEEACRQPQRQPHAAFEERGPIQRKDILEVVSQENFRLLCMQ